MDEREFVSLNDSGDRKLIVGQKEDGQRIYKVSSVAMSMASPVWKAMFNPTSGFLESNPDVPVEFPEDDPDALLILLRIAHLQFHEIPKAISFKWLTELAILCDKYDSVRLLQPFIEQWISPWTLLCLEPGYEAWLFIAWSFGCEQIFNLLAASLVLSIELDGEGRILNSGNELLVDHMPPGSIGKSTLYYEPFKGNELCKSDKAANTYCNLEGILKAREETITKLLGLFQDTIESLINRTSCASNSSELCYKESRDHIDIGLDLISCNITNLGLFISALYPLGLGSQKISATEIKICISKIVRELNKAQYTVQWSDYPTSCNLAEKLQPKVKEILDGVPLVLNENYKRHMEEQAKKSDIRVPKVPKAKEECIVM
jgi:hypothetical protein